MLSVLLTTHAKRISVSCRYTCIVKASALSADAFYKSKCPSVCPSVCLSVSSLLRYRLNVFLHPLPKVGCPIFLEIWIPWGKVIERSGLRIKKILIKGVKSPQFFFFSVKFRVGGSTGVWDMYEIVQFTVKSNFNRNEVFLLMIENIKTNKIGKFWPRDIKCTEKLPELLFCTLSPLVCHVFPQSSRKILSIIKTYTSQMSLFDHSKTVRARDLKFWEYYNHTLCVMCPVSHVTCHMSHVTF